MRQTALKNDEQQNKGFAFWGVFLNSEQSISFVAANYTVSNQSSGWPRMVS